MESEPFPVERREVCGDAGGDGDDCAGDGGGGEAAFDVVAADGIEHDIEPVASGDVVDVIGHRRIAVENCAVGAEVAGDLRFAGGGNRGPDGGTAGTGELESDVADAAGPAVNQDALAFADAGA